MSTAGRNRLITTALLTLLMLEAYCVTYYGYGNQDGYLAMTWIFVASGLLLCVLPFLLRPLGKEIAVGKPALFRPALLFALLSTLGMILFFGINAAHIFSAGPADYTKSDMIPMIQACCRRLVNGQKIYTPVYEIWGGEKPTYLPMMWAVWIPFEYLTNDLRWTSVFFLSGGIALIMSLFPFRKRAYFPELIVLSGVFWYYIWFLCKNDNFYLAQIQEPVVIGYYLLLGFALVKNKPWLIGLAIGCCLLSRYMLIFWVPVYLIYTFFFDSKRKALIVFGIATSMELFLFVLPYFIWQPRYFLDVIEYYHRSIAVYQREHSLGLNAIYPANRVDLVLRSEMLAATLPPLMAFGIFYPLREKIGKLDKRLFGICSLKLTMVCFYAFVETPFNYLFFVPAMFSSAICVLALRIASTPAASNEESPALAVQ